MTTAVGDSTAHWKGKGVSLALRPDGSQSQASARKRKEVRDWLKGSPRYQPLPGASGRDHRPIPQKPRALASSASSTHILPRRLIPAGRGISKGQAKTGKEKTGKRVPMRKNEPRHGGLAVSIVPWPAEN
ncbi:hypothetical protein KM043_006290 [Ampulex compressa]|nr:hypothetical protein KM043_006290 [Ampulex compressa]